MRRHSFFVPSPEDKDGLKLKRKAELRAGQVVKLLAPYLLIPSAPRWWRGCCSYTFGLDSDLHIPQAERDLTKHLYQKHFKRRYFFKDDHTAPAWNKGKHNLKEEDKKFIHY